MLEAKHEECIKTSMYGSINPRIEQGTLELETTKKKWKITLFAYALCISSMILACASIACVQVLGGAIPEFELNAMRFGTNFVIILPIILFKKCDIKMPKSSVPHMVALFFCSNIFNITYYEAAVYIPVGTVFAVYSSIVIIGNALLSIFIK